MHIEGDNGVTTATESTAATDTQATETEATVDQQSQSAQSPEQSGEQSQTSGDQGQAGEPEPPKSALEAVMRVMDKNRATEAGEQKAQEAATGEQKADGGDEDGQGDPEDKDLTGYIDKDEWAALPQKTQKRITQFRQKVRTLEGQLQELAPKAQTFDSLSTFMRQSGITREDFAEGLEIIRLLRQDPIEAYRRLQPIVQDLQQQVGEVLPADLQQAVDEGQLTETYAKELARQRKAAELREQQLRQRDEAAEQAQAAEQVQIAHRAVVGGIKAWEDNWKVTDPDYTKKAPMVFERMMVLMQTQGRPRTPEAAVKIAEQARKDVEERLKTIAPPPKPKQPVVQSGAAVQTSKQPATALEAAQQALQRMRQG